MATILLMITLNDDLLAIYFMSTAFHRQEEKKLSLSLVGSCKNQGKSMGSSGLVEPKPEPQELQLFALAEPDLDPDPT
jgi:hypothetical protein